MDAEILLNSGQTFVSKLLSDHTTARVQFFITEEANLCASFYVWFWVSYGR